MSLKVQFDDADDSNEVRHLLAVAGGVLRLAGELHRRRQIAIEPVVGVNGDDAPARSSNDTSDRAASDRKSAFPIGRPLADSRLISRRRRATP